MEQKTDFNTENTIITDSLIIRDNIMEWGNTMIQLSNVCSISTNTFVKTVPFPSMSILLALAGAILLTFMPIIGVISLIVAAAWIYLWKRNKDNPKKTMTLNIMMNSGSVFEFAFYNEQFKLRVLHVLEAIISGGSGLHIGDINIDIKNNNIDGDLRFMNGRI